MVGTVVQFDRERLAFDLLVGGRRVPGRLDEMRDETVAIIRTAAASESLRVRAVGSGSYDGIEQLTRFLRIDEVSYAEDEESPPRTIAPALISNRRRNGT